MERLIELHQDGKERFIIRIIIKVQATSLLEDKLKLKSVLSERYTVFTIQYSLNDRYSVSSS